AHGLHVGTFEYAKNFGHKLLICSVNPRDVVSVPRDCGFQKLRTCRYTVLDEQPLRVTETTYRSSVFEDDDEEEICPDCAEPVDFCMCYADRCDSCGALDDECRCPADGQGRDW
ncbi:MAG: hypothetical protein M3Y35_13360, partial [Actinomycetota bacterium]|nr:hypothetical protein [Actinomycetota bacterium]